jgi:hypothetical protein
MCSVGRHKEHNDVDLRTGKKLKEEGDDTDEQFSNTEIERGDIVSVPNQGEEGWEEKSLSGTGRAGKEPI